MEFFTDLFIYLVSQSASQAVSQFSWLVCMLCSYLPSELSFK